MSTNISSPSLVDSGPALQTAGLVHLIHQPAGAGPHPAVVMIHGRSGTEEVMWIFARTLPHDWIIASPRAILPDPRGGYSWHPVPDSEEMDDWPPLQAFDDAIAALTRFTEALPDLYNADPDRLYLMGFSQGAAAAYATALKHPALVQGIAGLVGFIPDDARAAVPNRPLEGLPMFAATGKEDDRIPLERARASAETLRALGADLTYKEYDTGHKLNAAAIRDLKAWWQKR